MSIALTLGSEGPGGPCPAIVSRGASAYARGVRPRLVLLASALVVLPASAVADARAYRGPHPVDLEGRWHLEEGTHVHGELAVGLEPFGDVDGVLVFLADPVAYAFPGEVWTYRGAHPLPGGLPAYCGVPGEHRHPFAPEGSFRRDDGGAYVFTGSLRGGVAMVRPGRVAPRRPIVSAGDVPPGDVASRDARPGIAPFWFGGCRHALVWGPDGPVPVPLDGCVPRVGHPRAPEAPGPPPRRSWFDGRYTRTRSGPAGAPRTLPRPRQAPDR